MLMAIHAAALIAQILARKKLVLWELKVLGDAHRSHMIRQH